MKYLLNEFTMNCVANIIFSFMIRFGSDFVVTKVQSEIFVLGKAALHGNHKCNYLKYKKLRFYILKNVK